MTMKRPLLPVILPALVAGGLILVGTGGWTLLSTPRPTPASITLTNISSCNGVANEICDNDPAQFLIATAVVKMSDGSTCSGPPTCTLTTSDTNIYAISGLKVVTARQLSPADDGSHPTTITAN